LFYFSFPAEVLKFKGFYLVANTTEDCLSTVTWISIEAYF